MYQSERLDKILDILEKNGYTTVKYLTEVLCYSNATINRDLTILESKKLVKRSYGGVELDHSKSIPLVFRYHKMKNAKMKIARTAAEFIEDGDTIFIDATTTTQYIGQYVENKKGVTVITNNMALATYLSDIGIEVICLGGKIVESPYMLSGVQTVENARKLHADKVFFSTAGILDNGKIVCSEDYYLLILTMLENADKSFFLVDKGKINPEGINCLCDIDDVDFVISDVDLKEIIKKDCKNTEFIIARK